MRALRDGITPAELVEETIQIYEAKDLSEMYLLMIAYQEYRYPAYGAYQKNIAKEKAKEDLDTIAQLADEYRKRKNLQAAKLAVEKGYAKEIGEVRQFYRMAVVYMPRK